MAVEKVTPMLLRVDLQCHCCYKKIKKTLCKFPQIRDQMYDEKKNIVAITVVCCSPEKIRDKLCRKGGKVIKSIEIIEPSKPKEAQNPKQLEKPKEAEKAKEAEKPKEKPKGAEKPNEGEKPKEKPKDAGKPEPPKSDGKGDKPKDGGAPAEKPKEASKAEPAKSQEPAAKPLPAAQAKGPEPVPVNGVPSVFPYCGPSYDPYAAGPYYHGYGFPPPPQPCYEGYYGHAHGHGHELGNGYGHGYAYGYGGVAHANRCDNYFTEENPQACTIM